MVDNDPQETYLYEVIVVTGMRTHSGTDSKVNSLASFSMRTHCGTDSKVNSLASLNCFAIYQ